MTRCIQYANLVFSDLPTEVAPDNSQSNWPKIPPADINGVTISDFKPKKIALSLIISHSPRIV